MIRRPLNFERSSVSMLSTCYFLIIRSIFLSEMFWNLISISDSFILQEVSNSEF